MFKFQELLIEVTTGCNLRCKYCVFSGNYTNQRVHGTKMIDFQQCKKTIDLYFRYLYEAKKYNENIKPTIAFYGGEPLLNYNVIKKSVDYIHKIYNGKIYITLTTNGTLLTDEMIDYFVNNDVILIFSIDGPSKEHNRNRVFKNDMGSFDIAYSNAIKYSKKKKDIVFVISVYDPKTNFDEFLKFFANSKYLYNLAISPVNPYDTKYYDNFSAEDYKKYNEYFINLKKDFFANLNSKTKDDPYKSIINLLIGKQTFSVLMRKTNGISNKKSIKFTGACIPGEKLFADIDGNLRPCEKVVPGMNIGNINTGIDFAKIKNYLNQYNNQIVKHCLNCKYKTLCSYCFQAFWNGTKFQYNKEMCDKIKITINKSLSLYSSIMENDPAWFNVFTNDYYQKVRDVLVELK